MRKRLLLAAGLLALSANMAQAAPDVIMILLDETAATRIGPVARQISAATPNINSIANGGINFYNAYAQPACIPARTALLAGQWPQRRSLGNSQGNGPFAPGTLVTLADKLKPEYATHLVGKWHQGKSAGKHPLDRGFDTAFFFSGLTPYYSGPDPNGRDLFDQRTRTKNSGLLSNTLATRAVSILNKSSTKPKFLYFATNGIHDPLQGTAAQRVIEMDAAVGKVLAAAKDDTLIILMGDNGYASSALRGKKLQILEGGVQVQLHVMWKGRIAAGQTVQTPASIVDISPTILKAAGKSTGATDGFDLRNLPSNRAIFLDAFNSDPGPGPTVEPGQGVRRGSYVWYENYLGIPKQLYNVVLDPKQNSNLAGRDPTLEAQLHQVLLGFRAVIQD